MIKISDQDRILIVTSIEFERDAILNYFRNLDIGNKYDIISVGVGSVRAAVGLMSAVCSTGQSYSYIINAGIAGGFSNRVEVGDVVLADSIIAADLGIEDEKNFIFMSELGMGETAINPDPELYKLAQQSLLYNQKISCKTGPILTVNSVTGTSVGAAELVLRIPNAYAEAMEGFGLAVAAKALSIPMLEIRAISNMVGPRDREMWQIDLALENLSQAALSIVINLFNK